MFTIDGLTSTTVKDMILRSDTLETAREAYMRQRGENLKRWSNAAAGTVAGPMLDAGLIYTYAATDRGLVLWLNNGDRVMLHPELKDGGLDPNETNPLWHLSEPFHAGLPWRMSESGIPGDLTLRLIKRAKKTRRYPRWLLYLFHWTTV